MTSSKPFAVTALLLAAAIVPGTADARQGHRRGHHHRGPATISYLHNYGPGRRPGSIAYYDGPASYLCYRGAAAYIGQDNRRHPCN